MVFVIDTRKEEIAVREARKLNISVIAVVDTNSNPDDVDYVIPGNDDALRAIRLFSSKISDAIISGRSMLQAQEQEAALIELGEELDQASLPENSESVLN